MAVTYHEAVRYIGDIPKFTKKHTLEHTRGFLAKLNHPCRNAKVFHVAGTNGKGSVCAYLQAILLCEGKHVGCFTSPHLETIRERIKIDGKNITEEAFLRAFHKTMEAVERLRDEGLEHPSYFEFLYGMGMAAFEEAGIDYLILETGLGGRLDATNAFETPSVSILTSIGLDHKEILGETVPEIAAEKAGIIRRGVPVVFDASDAESAAVIEKTARQKGTFCRGISKDAVEIQEITDKHIAFLTGSEYDSNTVWEIRGTGVYQTMNVVLALEAAHIVLGAEVQVKRWQKALAEVVWPGRMEEVLPGVVLDGAHNLPAIRQFVESVRAQEAYEIQTAGEKKEKVLLFSAVADKDYTDMIALLCEGVRAKAYVITQIDDKRGAASGELERVFQKYAGCPVYVKDSIQEAFELAMREKGEGGRLYCLGSLYLVGELKTMIGGSYA